MSIQKSSKRVKDSDSSPRRSTQQPSQKRTRRRAKPEAPQWREVSAAQPCPICDKPNWCSVNVAGDCVHCRRNPDEPATPGWTREATLTDKNGEDYGRWICTEGKVASAGRRSTKLNRRDQVYRALLDEFELDVWAWNSLLDRDLWPIEIRAYGYKYIDSESAKRAVQSVIDAGLSKYLRKVPGFVNDDGRWSFRAPAGIVVPVRGVDGRIVALKVRLRRPKDGRKYVYASSKKYGGPGPGSPVHVPLHNRTQKIGVVRVTEGELKADIATALSGQLTLGLPGVTNFRKSLDVLEHLGAKGVVLAFDADFRDNVHVAKALFDAVHFFRERFADVAVETWRERDGKGIDDLLAIGMQPQILSGEQIDALLNEIEELHGPFDQPAERPTIVVGPDEHDVNDKAIAALASDNGLFQRGDHLVRVIRGGIAPSGIKRPAGSPRIVAIKRETLRERLSKAISWQAFDPKGQLVPTHPPNWSTAAVHARGHWEGIRPLEGIVNSPVLRADGSVLDQPGYDAATGLICELSTTMPSIPAHPTAGQIRTAVAALREVVIDFPFASEVHLAAWVSFLLTTLSQFAFDGPAPLFLFDANAPGTGKGLLCDVAAMIATGRKTARTAPVDDENEARKRITSIALAGDQMVLIDNIDGTLGGPSLEAALTSSTWRDRLLGGNEMVELPMSAIWAATGNNVALTRDMTRRTTHIRLETSEENPEEREGFQHPDLLRWVAANRGQLLAAAMTILRNYCAAGRPDQHLKMWGSYEGWSDLVRGAVVLAGLPDPGESRQGLANRADTENQALRALFTGLQLFDPKGAGLTCANILAKISEESTRTMESAEMIRNALAELCPTASGLPSPSAIGAKLRHLQGRVIGGRCLDKRDQHNTAAWFVRDATGEGGHGGHGGHATTPTKSAHGKRPANPKSARASAENKSPMSPKSTSRDANTEVI